MEVFGSGCSMTHVKPKPSARQPVTPLRGEIARAAALSTLIQASSTVGIVDKASSRQVL
jgi:hypothetical protein